VSVSGRGLRRLKLPYVVVITYVMLLDTYFGQLAVQCEPIYGTFLRTIIQSFQQTMTSPEQFTDHIVFCIP